MAEIELPPGTTQADLEKALKTLNEPEDGSIIFKTIEYGPEGAIKVSRDTFKGKSFNAIRKFYTERTSGELKPGKGVTFQFEDIDEIIEGLQALKEWQVENPGD